MSEIKVSVIEQPGKLGRQKAREIAHMLVRYYEQAAPAERAEIDRRAKEMQQKKQAES